MSECATKFMTLPEIRKRWRGINSAKIAKECSSVHICNIITDAKNDIEILFNANSAAEDLLNQISRSACLQQRVSGKCICFRCEAERVLKKFFLLIT